MEGRNDGQEGGRKGRRKGRVEGRRGRNPRILEPHKNVVNYKNRLSQVQEPRYCSIHDPFWNKALEKDI